MLTQVALFPLFHVREDSLQKYASLQSFCVCVCLLCVQCIQHVKAQDTKDTNYFKLSNDHFSLNLQLKKMVCEAT